MSSEKIGAAKVIPMNEAVREPDHSTTTLSGKNESQFHLVATKKNAASDKENGVCVPPPFRCLENFTEQICQGGILSSIEDVTKYDPSIQNLFSQHIWMYLLFTVAAFKEGEDNPDDLEWPFTVKRSLSEKELKKVHDVVLAKLNEGAKKPLSSDRLKVTNALPRKQTVFEVEKGLVNGRIPIHEEMMPIVKIEILPPPDPCIPDVS